MCIARSNIVTYPHANVTQPEFDAVKLAYGELTSIDLVWSNQSKLRITLNADLYEPSNCVLFLFR